MYASVTQRRWVGSIASGRSETVSLSSRGGEARGGCQPAVRASLGLKKVFTDPVFWECVLSLLPLQILAFIGLLEWIRP